MLLHAADAAAAVLVLLLLLLLLPVALLLLHGQMLNVIKANRFNSQITWGRGELQLKQDNVSVLLHVFSDNNIYGTVLNS